MRSRLQDPCTASARAVLAQRHPKPHSPPPGSGATDRLSARPLQSVASPIGSAGRCSAASTRCGPSRHPGSVSWTVTGCVRRARLPGFRRCPKSSRVRACCPEATLNPEGASAASGLAPARATVGGAAPGAWSPLGSRKGAFRWAEVPAGEAEVVRLTCPGPRCRSPGGRRAGGRASRALRALRSCAGLPAVEGSSGALH